MNFKTITWLDLPERTEESVTPPTKCPIYEIHKPKPAVAPKRGRSLSDFVAEMERDNEKAELINDARVWAGQTFEEKDGGVTVRSLRLKKHLSQVKLAALMKTSQSHVARIEKGRDSISFETLCKLSEALEVDYNTLVEAIKRQSSLLEDGTSK